MIQVNGLTKDYGARRAIDNLTFDAEQGEIVGFLGPNGAGKTTTMRILTGYMPPSEGTATVAGYDIIEESLEVRKRVGYLPETVPLYNDMTALEYLKFMADLRRIPDPEERAYETLEGVNLKDRANSYIGTFSKGMRQRIGLAQALIHPPLRSNSILLPARSIWTWEAAIASASANRATIPCNPFSSTTARCGTNG